MVVVWVALVVALVVHEGSHYLLLRLAGLRPRPSFHFPGLGWKFHTGNVSASQLIDIWLVGPVTETLVWATAALLFPRWSWELILVMVIELATNVAFPGSDGRRAMRLWHRRHDADVSGSAAGCGGQVPDFALPPEPGRGATTRR
ncbi:MAG: hypothetical protein ACYCX9_00565 [Candidatus Dormibacteria bacterium]|jgi:hypothetical protein